MIYDGNFMNSLEETAIRIVNSQICGTKLESGKICGQTLGRHSFIGDNCPSNSPDSLYLASTFSDDLEVWYARFNQENLA